MRANVKFPNWIYWRSGDIREEYSLRVFYYSMGRKKIRAKIIVPGTLIEYTGD